MPIISCPSCKSRFKVKIDTVGKTIPCPRCKDPFKAVAMHQTPRKSHGSGPIVYASIAVGAVLVVILISAMTGSDEPDPALADADRGDRSAEVTTSKKSGADALMTPAEMLGSQTEKLLDALRTGDHPLLPGWVAYERMHEHRLEEGLEERPWNQLSQAESYAKREQYLGILMGDEATRKFSRASTVEGLTVESFGSGKGRVRATLENPLTETSQKIKVHFVTSAGSWKVYHIEREPLGQPEPEVAETPEETMERVVARRRSSQGTVEPVELIADTPSSVTRSIERALDVLKDMSTTVEANAARSRLLEAGKPAVPHLLNALIPLDFKDVEQLQIANRISQALGDLSGQDFVIVPGMNEGSMLGEGAGDNETNRRKWFGWWRDHAKTYQGPPEPDFGDESDLPNRKKSRRDGR